MKVLLTGAAGQLGQELIASRPPEVELIACSRGELDLADAEACRAAVQQHRPDWVLNAGAYTAVDKAESEPELAAAVNAGAPAAFAEALALVQAHQAAGDEVVIVTATNEFVTRPIATAFGVKELIAIELARDDQGEFTGEIAGTPSFREGKVTRVQRWLAERGLTWADVDITFYSDSTNDLPLLEKAQHPVATNPSEGLRSLAQARGWRILDLFPPHP